MAVANRATLATMPPVLGIFCTRLPRIAIVICAAASFMVAVVLSQAWRVHDFWWLLSAAPLLVVGWRRQSWVFLAGIVCFFMVAGLLRGTQYMDKKQLYTQLQKQKVVLIARANTDAVYGTKHQLTFEVRDARLADGRALVGLLQISGFGESMVYKGDWLRIEGTLLASRGNASGRMSFASLQVITRGSSVIDDVRRRFAAGIQSALPEPAASFGMGLLVGQRNTLPQDTTEQLQKVGLTHIIAVSGYNLTIIMQAMGRLMKRRSKFQYMFCSVTLVVVFLLLTGQSPSIVRASVVCGLGLWAWWYGRVINPLVLLCTAAALTVAGNPLYMWGNVSWMLSFLAFFGVLVVSPLVTRRWFSRKPPGLIGAMVLESLCAEVMTLPYVLYIFGTVSTVSTLANVLVAAFVPLAMLCSLVAGLAGMAFSVLAGWVAWPATWVLTYMLDMVQLLSTVPHAFIEHIGFSLWMLVASYALVGALLLISWHKSRQNGIITDNTASNSKE